MHTPDADERADGAAPMQLDLDEDTVAHYEARAHAAGRTLEAQLLYELKVNRGLCPPDPGDEEARERRRVFRRIFSQSPLMG